MKKGILKKISIVLLLLFLFISLSSLYTYFSWRKSFYEKNYIICTEDLANQEFYIDSKIKKFVLSNSENEFVELTREEVLYLLSQNVQTAGGLEVQNICIDAEKSLWKIYFNTRLDVFNIPWVRLDVVKENRETAELYVKDIYIGDMLIPESFVKSVIVEINRGISDAVLLVNENAFLGRTIKNIELMADRVIIKGNIER